MLVLSSQIINFFYYINNFVKISKNLARYKFENNFVGLLENNYIRRSLVAEISKLFAASLIMLEFST